MSNSHESDKEAHLSELTVRGMILGALITGVFTASNVYLGLRVGLTFSSAIPAAVISMAVLRWLGKANILENNMVQTQASAAGTLSAIIFVIPGLLMIGYWQGFEFWETLLVAACGGCMGVLFTIPLRRAMVVHSDLPYPEGLAAAEILKVGAQADKKSGGIKEILMGSVFSSIVAFLSGGLQVISGALSVWFAAGRGVSQLAIGYSSALIGAGYLIGLGAGLAILAGILIAWLGLVPYFTWGMTGTESELIDFAQAAYRDKVRLIGAGAMGVAAIWTLITLAKPVIDGIKESVAVARQPREERRLHRTDTDMSLKAVVGVFLLMLLGLLLIFYSFVQTEGLPFGQTVAFTVVGVGVALATGFFVVAACAYMAGLVGSSSSPISGIGILAIIISSLIIMLLAQSFGVFDLPGGEKFATAAAIFTTTIILAIACVSNDNMQDLKTGFLVGATPWRQQVALLIGCGVGAVVIAPVLNLLYEAYGFVGAMPRAGMDESTALAAPQASLMTTIAQGIFSSQLAWDYICFGVGLGVVLVLADYLLRKHTEHLSLPPLAVGMGIYLPPSVQTPVVIGAVMGYVLRKILAKRSEAEADAGHNRGTLFAAGLIVGESLMGVILAVCIVISVSGGGSEAPLAVSVGDAWQDPLGFFAFAAIIAVFVRQVLHKNLE